MAYECLCAARLAPRRRVPRAATVTRPCRRAPGLIGAATVLALGAASGQPPPDTTSIDAIFAQYDQRSTPGCALGVYRDGRIVYEQGYGSANLDYSLPITPDTVFFVGSVSKQFTAFAAALLIEQRQLALSDSLRKYFSELPEWGDAITVDDLIHHTSGIRDFLTLWEFSGRTFEEGLSSEAAIDLIARQRALDFAPGTQWSYSNSGYFLLAEIINRATGTPLSTFAHDAMFAPLGMTSTHFHDDNTLIVPRRATGYLPDDAGDGFRVVATTFALVGDGGVFTTVRDLIKWDENFYDNRLGGGAALIEKFTTPGRLANGEPHPYAYGLFPGTYRGLPTVQHGGSFIGFRSQLLRFPTEHVSMAVLCNDWTANAEDLAQRVADSYLATRLEAPPTPPRVAGPTAVEIEPADLRRFVGRYALEQPGLFASVIERTDGLALEIDGNERRLIPTSATSFAFDTGPGEIEFVIGDAAPSLLFRGIPVPPAPMLVPPTLSATQLSEYAGRYTSDELDTWFAIRHRDGGLELQRRNGPWRKLEAIATDRFLAGPADLKFERDNTAKVSGFFVSTQRASNIRFTRDTRPDGAAN